MNTKLTVARINPSSVAKVLSLTMGILVAVSVVLNLAAAMAGFHLTSTNPFTGIGSAVWVIAITPFIYMIGAYIVTFVFCLAFNFSSRLFGGIRIDIAE